MEAEKGHREPRRLSRDIRRRISNGPKALQTINTVMEELCIQNKQRQIKGGNQGKGKTAGRRKRLIRDLQPMPGEGKALPRFLLETHRKQKPEKLCGEMSEGRQSWCQKEVSPGESWDAFQTFQAEMKKMV